LEQTRARDFTFGKGSGGIEQLHEARENSAYLPGVKLSDAIGLTSDLKVCAEADLDCFRARFNGASRKRRPSQKVSIKRDAVLLSCIKGIEHGSGSE